MAAKSNGSLQINKVAIAAFSQSAAANHAHVHDLVEQLVTNVKSLQENIGGKDAELYKDGFDDMTKTAYAIEKMMGTIDSAAKKIADSYNVEAANSKMKASESNAALKSALENLKKANSK